MENIYLAHDGDPIETGNRTPTFHVDGDYLQEDARERFGRADHWNTESEAEHNAVEEAHRKHLASLRRILIAPGAVFEKTEGLVEGKDFEVEKVQPGVLKYNSQPTFAWPLTLEPTVTLTRREVDDFGTTMYWKGVNAEAGNLPGLFTTPEERIAEEVNKLFTGKNK